MSDKDYPSERDEDEIAAIERARFAVYNLALSKAAELRNGLAPILAQLVAECSETAEVQQSHGFYAAIRATLGAAETETLDEAARRVVRERDDARCARGPFGDAKMREVEIARLTRERDEARAVAKAERDTANASLADMHDVLKRALAERDEARANLASIAAHVSGPQSERIATLTAMVRRLAREATEPKVGAAILDELAAMEAEEAR